MSWRLLLDENIEYEIELRLWEAGYDIQHVARIDALGEGTNDRRVVEYSRDSGRFILTYDDDFLSEFSEDSYIAVLFVPDQSLTPADVEAIIDSMVEHYPPEEVDGVVHAGVEWL